nr:mechanosensitive ion channel protein 5-like isoform X2 [Physcomitrium patens]|eukprot:XP_024379968.1 mechanosensitive ion channel protein 5-like isoform X2 [Physcomitrella patens]
MEERLSPRVCFEESSGELEPEWVKRGVSWHERTDHDQLEKASLLGQESALGNAPQKRWRAKSLSMGHGKVMDSSASYWKKQPTDLAIEMDHVNADNRSSQLKRSSLPHGSETQINSQSGPEMNKDDLDVSSNWQGFFQVDSSHTNSQKIPALLSRLPYSGENDTNIIENPAFAFDAVRTTGDRFNRGEELRSLRLRKSSSSSQHNSPRDDVVLSASTMSTSPYNRAKSRFAEPRKPMDHFTGSPRRSGVVRSGQRVSDPQRSQHLRSGKLWSGQLKSQMMKSGMMPLGPLEEDEDPFNDLDMPDRPKFQRKLTCGVCLEWIAFFVLLGAVICSRVLPKARNMALWGLLLWKWFLLALVIVCGRLVSGWVVRSLVIVFEINFLLRKRVLYFVYALRRGVRNCIWLASVLMAWNFMFDSRAQALSAKLVYITKVLQCILLAAILFLVKVFLVKLLASSFHVGTYFERIRDSLFNQYVLEILSGPPVLEMDRLKHEDEKLIEEVSLLKKAGATTKGLEGLPGIGENTEARMSKNLGRSRTGISREVKPGSNITIEHLHKLNRKNVSVFNMKRLINLVKHQGVTTFGQGLDGGVGKGVDTEIKSEWQAKVVAKEIFDNVSSPGAPHIIEEDLLRFLSEQDTIRTLALFEGAMETGKITKKALKSWVNVYQERRALALSLSDTKSAVSKLHRIIDVILFVIVVVIWLLILDIATTQLLLFVSSQLVLMVFIFGNTLKTVFEAIVFVFVHHPFDVGDRCLIDGTMYVVEEMNILTTVFLGDFNAKVWYPNSVLASKPITNYYRSPDMGDMFEFFIATSTTAEKIGRLKEHIGRYITGNPQHWKETFVLNCLDCAPDTGKLKLVVGLSHTMNYHNIGEKVARKSQLILEMKKGFEEIGIEYHLPPQDVHLKSIPGTTINFDRSL